MEIKRDRYLNKLISFMWDGQVKVITGIRRCGKSYLLKNLFRDYLISTGVSDDHIIDLALDLTKDIRYRNPLELAKFVRVKAGSSIFLWMKFKCPMRSSILTIPMERKLPFMTL